MRVLITGATGLLGRALLAEFSDCDVTGTGLSRCSGPNIVKLDLQDHKAIVSLLDSIKPQVIIHNAAERRPDVCKSNPDFARSINVESTRIVAEWVGRNADCFLVYISTDYVFDGANPPYRPNAKPNPLNYYGISKLEGEEAIWSNCSSAAVLRIPVLYGAVESIGESAVTTLFSTLQVGVPVEQRKEVAIDDVQIRFPTFAPDVAAAVKGLVLRRESYPDLAGTWHFSGDEATTKYKIAVTMAELLGQSHSHIRPLLELPVESPLERRPMNAQLDTRALTLMGIAKVTPFKEALLPILLHLQELEQA